MKYFIIIFLLFGFLINPVKTFAQENWVINTFNSEITLQDDGYVSIVETIDVDFGSVQKHGIFRDIPFEYALDNGGKRFTEIEVTSVSNSGTQIPYKESKSGGYIRLKIGDPDQTISGTQGYKISYIVSGVLNSFDNHDELYWNATGNAWPVPILSATATVTLPKEAITQTTCFQGVLGSKKTCNSDKTEGKKASFTAQKLGVGEGLSIVVGYEKGIAPILEIEPPKNIFDELFTLTNIGIFTITTLFGLGVVFWLWWDRGRDYWHRKRYIDDPNAKHEVRPVGAHETTVVEYSPPENLRPAQIGTLVDERADTLDITATIVDLATRGYINIAENPKKWVFGSKDYVLTKQQKDDSKLLPYEKELFSRLFDSEDEIKISKLKTKFYKDLKIVKKKLYKQVKTDRFFYEDPQSRRSKYLIIAVVVGSIGGVVSWICFMFPIGIFITLPNVKEKIGELWYE